MIVRFWFYLRILVVGYCVLHGSLFELFFGLINNAFDLTIRLFSKTSETDKFRMRKIFS